MDQLTDGYQPSGDHAEAGAPPKGGTSVMAPQLAAPVNPFAREHDARTNAGAVAIESSRAIAEAQGKLIIAKRFPRDEARAFEMAMNASKRPGLANEAFYSYKRGNENVSGPSIRLAEELARCWGNLDYGLRELSREDGASEMEAFAWDLETNTRSLQQFTVAHARDTRSAGKKTLTDERDIYEMTANMGARRLRARILAILPKDLVDAAVAECRKTIAGKNDEPMPARVQRVVAKFNGLGVNTKHLESYLQHGLDAMVPDELADLHGIFMAIKDGQAKVADFFAVTLADPTATAADPKPAAAKAAAGKDREKPAKAEKDKPAEDGAAPQADDPPAGDKSAPALAQPAKADVQRADADEQPQRADANPPAQQAKPAAKGPIF